LIEDHYSQRAGKPQPMVIEWAKDGITNELFIVQARPETVHSAKPQTAIAEVHRLNETISKMQAGNSRTALGAGKEYPCEIMT
jgi:pyruvate, water dikinase